MKEIMENMNELKDKLFAAINVICKDYEAKRPEFKVPGWYTYRRPGEIEIFYVTIKDGNYFKDAFGGMWFIKDCRSATPQEIESRLRKIAEEKGFKEGVKVKVWICEDIRILQGNPHYVPDWQINEDAFAFGNDVIWRPTHGWVEIIPDKKKLPKTREEYRAFLRNYYFQGMSKVDEFLNSYTE